MTGRGIEAVADRPTEQAFWRLSEELSTGGIGFDDFQCAGIDDQDRLGDRLEEHAIARLGLPQPDIVALHRLLRGHQPLLDRGKLPQITADRDHLSFGARLDGRIEDGYRGAFAECLIDMSPLRLILAARALQQGLDLDPALGGHGF